MPTLTDLLDPSRVAVGVSVRTQAEATARALARLEGHPAVRDPARLAADVRARERVLSTGVGEGVALPHARTPAVTGTVAVLLTLAEPVDWQALDGAPVDLVVLFAGPEGQRAAHVRLLAQISRTLSRAGVRQHLAEAGTPEAAIAALDEG